jgi:hypothetical protein
MGGFAQRGMTEAPRDPLRFEVISNSRTSSLLHAFE